MRSLAAIAALTIAASVANAQDTTVVIVRHLPAQQDTGVVVRHLAPPPAAIRQGSPYGAPRYGLRGSSVLAKDPNVGTMLSFIFPGGGQYYAEQPGKGLAITMLSIGAPIIGYANVDHHRYNTNEPCPLNGCSDYNRRDTDWTPAWLGLGVGIGSWLYGIATAGTDVQHWNQKHGVRFVAGPGRAGFAVALP
jgi:hypothetical protein